MNIAPISEPNTMMPAHGRDPEDRARRDLQVVERVGGALLADDEADERGHRHEAEPDRGRVGVGNHAKLIARINAPDEHDRRARPRGCRRDPWSR